MFARLLFSLLLSGCAMAIERDTVRTHFHEQLACSDVKVTREAGGYRVSGCDVTAHYVCVDENAAERAQLDANAAAREGDDSTAAAVGGLFDALYAASLHDTCSLDRPRFEQVVVGDVATRDHGVRVEVRGQALANAGYVALSAVPEVQPELTWLSFHGHAALPEERCQVDWFVDGVRVPTSRAERIGPRAARFPLPTHALAGAARAVRVSARVCGLPIEFDESARRTLTEFAAHAREHTDQDAVLVEAQPSPY